MARAKKKEAEPEPEDTEEGEDFARAARDVALARIAIALGQFEAGKEALTGALALFADTEDDEDGSDRMALVEAALDSAGAASRALEAAQTQFEDFDDLAWEIGEEDDEE